MVTLTRSVIIATGLLKTYSRCFYDNMTKNKGHNGVFILSDSPNSIKGEMMNVKCKSYGP